MTRPKAIDKVRKLLALADDRGATVAEAKLARERAEALIARYDLKRSEYAPEPEPPPIPAPRPRPRARPMPGFAVGNTYNGTRPFATTATGNTNVHVVWMV
jgi:hypothetical protein